MNEVYTFQELYNEYYLAHYGVKGMKWGIRHDPERVGRKTKRKTITTKEDLERRKKIYKTIAIASGVTMGAVAGYLAYNKFGPDFLDKTIKAGVELQRLSNMKSKYEDLQNQPFYAVFKKGDKGIYKDKFVGHLKFNYGSPTVVKKIIDDKNIKIASTRTQKKVVEDLCRTNPSFRNYYKRDCGGKISTFNRYLVYKDPEVHTFYNELSKRGYSAVYDMNDRYFSKYRANSPIVVFNPGNLSVNTVSYINRTNGEQAMHILKRNMIDYGKMTLSMATISGLGYGAYKADEEANELDFQLKKMQK